MMEIVFRTTSPSVGVKGFNCNSNVKLNKENNKRTQKNNCFAKLVTVLVDLLYFTRPFLFDV